MKEPIDLYVHVTYYIVVLDMGVFDYYFYVISYSSLYRCSIPPHLYSCSIERGVVYPWVGMIHAIELTRIRRHIDKKSLGRV